VRGNVAAGNPTMREGQESGVKGWALDKKKKRMHITKTRKKEIYARITEKGSS